ncbi:MAG: DUF2752 domain-containing protein [Oscillospiraceae bacterium]|jgi:hypothetical protein|nr:DUF2752 domain-containing protein [Oscillospiraceae bacterium]
MSNKIKILLLLSFFAIAAVLYFIFNPIDYIWFPKCAFYQLTGLECPTCGSQRAIHAILHGNFLEGLKHNPFILISIPYGLGLILICLFNTPFTARLRAKLLHPAAVRLYCIIFIGWWIGRNLI